MLFAEWDLVETRETEREREHLKWTITIRIERCRSIPFICKCVRNYVFCSKRKRVTSQNIVSSRRIQCVAVRVTWNLIRFECLAFAIWRRLLFLFRVGIDLNFVHSKVGMNFLFDRISTDEHMHAGHVQTNKVKSFDYLTFPLIMSVCTWAVIPTAYQCHILSYPNSVRFSWCHTVPVHLNNRFSVIQSTAHNFHLTCALDVCHLHTTEQIARDALAYESTFSDTTEWTISVIRCERERERKMCLEIKTNIRIRHSVELKKRDYYGNVGGFVRLCLGSHSLGTWKMFANFIIRRWLCDVVCTRTQCRSHQSTTITRNVCKYRRLPAMRQHNFVHVDRRDERDNTKWTEGVRGRGSDEWISAAFSLADAKGYHRIVHRSRISNGMRANNEWLNEYIHFASDKHMFMRLEFYYFIYL